MNNQLDSIREDIKGGLNSIKNQLRQGLSIKHGMSQDLNNKCQNMTKDMRQDFNNTKEENSRGMSHKLENLNNNVNE